MTPLTPERLDLLRSQHVPNTPRTHDADGHRVDEPVQCRQCLQAFPCDLALLLDIVDGVRGLHTQWCETDLEDLDPLMMCEVLGDRVQP